MPLSPRARKQGQNQQPTPHHMKLEKTLIAQAPQPTTTAASIAKNAGECPATNTGRHQVKQGADHCHKCGAR